MYCSNKIFAMLRHFLLCYWFIFCHFFFGRPILWLINFVVDQSCDKSILWYFNFVVDQFCGWFSISAHFYVCCLISSLISLTLVWSLIHVDPFISQSYSEHWLFHWSLCDWVSFQVISLNFVVDQFCCISKTIQKTFLYMIT